MPEHTVITGVCVSVHLRNLLKLPFTRGFPVGVPFASRYSFLVNKIEA